MTSAEYVTKDECKTKHNETKRGIAFNRGVGMGVGALIVLFVTVVSWAAIIGHKVDSRQGAHESYHEARDKSIDQTLLEIKTSIKELVHEVRTSNGHE